MRCEDSIETDKEILNLPSAHVQGSKSIANKKTTT
jgi:hypothetical protein